jgi:hypothetical protein
VTAGPKLLAWRFQWAVFTYRLANGIFATRQLLSVATAPARELRHQSVQALSSWLRQACGPHVGRAGAQLLAAVVVNALVVMTAAAAWAAVSSGWRRPRRSQPRCGSGSSRPKQQ